MAVAFVNDSTNVTGATDNTAATTSVTAVPPSATVANDFVLISRHHSVSSANFKRLANYTFGDIGDYYLSPGGTTASVVNYRIASASAETYPWTGMTSSTSRSWGTARFTGVDTTSPIRDLCTKPTSGQNASVTVDGSFAPSTAASTFTVSGMDTNADGCMGVVCFVTATQVAASASNGWTIALLSDKGTGAKRHYIAYKAYATASGTTADAVTITLSGSDNVAGRGFVLAPKDMSLTGSSAGTGTSYARGNALLKRDSTGTQWAFDRIGVLGDSITHGPQVGKPYRYMDLLFSGDTNNIATDGINTAWYDSTWNGQSIRVRNGGQSGFNSGQVLAALQGGGTPFTNIKDTATSKGSDLLVINLGANDKWSSRSQAQITADIANVANTWTVSGGNVLWGVLLVTQWEWVNDAGPVGSGSFNRLVTQAQYRQAVADAATAIASGATRPFVQVVDIRDHPVSGAYYGATRVNIPDNWSGVTASTYVVNPGTGYSGANDNIHPTITGHAAVWAPAIDYGLHLLLDAPANAVDLSTGTSAGSSTTTGSLSLDVLLGSGTSSASGSTSGSLSVELAMSGTSDGSSTTTGQAALEVGLSGTSAGDGTTFGSMDDVILMVGTSAGSSDTTGSLSVQVQLAAGADTGTGTDTGTMDAGPALSGASAGSGTTSGSLENPVVLTGTSAGSGTDTGTMGGVVALIGVSAGTSTSTLTVTTPRTYRRPVGATPTRGAPLTAPFNIRPVRRG